MAEGSSAAKSVPENTTSASDTDKKGTPDKKESLEDLLTTLSQQINNSDWLQQNTAETFAAANPEVAQAFQEVAVKKRMEKGDGDQG